MFHGMGDGDCSSRYDGRYIYHGRHTTTTGLDRRDNFAFVHFIWDLGYLTAVANIHLAFLTPHVVTSHCSFTTNDDSLAG